MHGVYTIIPDGRPTWAPLRIHSPTDHESRTTKKHWRSSHLSCRIQDISVWLYTFTSSGHKIRHKRLTRFCASQNSFKTGSRLIPENPGRIGSRSSPRTTNHESQKSTGSRPTSPAESRTSLSGCIPSHHQVTRFGISDSHGFARRKAPSKPVPCLSQGTLVGWEAAHSPQATNHESRTTKKH